MPHELRARLSLSVADALKNVAAFKKGAQAGFAGLSGVVKQHASQMDQMKSKMADFGKTVKNVLEQRGINQASSRTFLRPQQEAIQKARQALAEYQRHMSQRRAAMTVRRDPFGATLQDQTKDWQKRQWSLAFALAKAQRNVEKTKPNDDQQSQMQSDARALAAAKTQATLAAKALREYNAAQTQQQTMQRGIAGIESSGGGSIMARLTATMNAKAELGKLLSDQIKAGTTTKEQAAQTLAPWRAEINRLETDAKKAGAALRTLFNERQEFQPRIKLELRKERQSVDRKERDNRLSDLADARQKLIQRNRPYMETQEAIRQGRAVAWSPDSPSARAARRNQTQLDLRRERQSQDNLARDKRLADLAERRQKLIAAMRARQEEQKKPFSFKDIVSYLPGRLGVVGSAFAGGATGAVLGSLIGMGIGAAIDGFRRLFDFMRDGINSVMSRAREIQNLQAQTGVGKGATAVISRAAEMANMDPQAMALWFGRFQANIGTPQKLSPSVSSSLVKLQQYGLPQWTELRKMKPEEQFFKILKAVGSVNDQTLQSSLSLALFNRQGVEMQRIFNNPAILDQAREQVGALADVYEKSGDKLAYVDRALEGLGTEKKRGFFAGLFGDGTDASVGVAKMFNSIDTYSIGKVLGKSFWTSFLIQHPLAGLVSTALGKYGQQVDVGTVRGPGEADFKRYPDLKSLGLGEQTGFSKIGLFSSPGGGADTGWQGRVIDYLRDIDANTKPLLNRKTMEKFTTTPANMKDFLVNPQSMKGAAVNAKDMGTAGVTPEKMDDFLVNFRKPTPSVPPPVGIQLTGFDGEVASKVISGLLLDLPGTLRMPGGFTPGDIGRLATPPPGIQPVGLNSDAIVKAIKENAPGDSDVKVNVAAPPSWSTRNPWAY